MSQGPNNPWGPPQPPQGGFAPVSPQGQQQWGQQPMQPMYGGPPPQQPKSGTGKVLLLGCVGLIALVVVGSGVAFVLVGKALTGTRIATAEVTPGMPFTLQYTPQQGGQAKVWAEVDLAFTNSLQLSGQVVSQGSGAVNQYTLQFAPGSGCHNPVVGSNSSMCMNWVSTSFNGTGSVRGRTRLFTVPTTAHTAGTLSGAINVGPGTTVNSFRIYVEE